MDKQPTLFRKSGQRGMELEVLTIFFKKAACGRVYCCQWVPSSFRSVGAALKKKKGKKRKWKRKRDHPLKVFEKQQQRMSRECSGVTNKSIPD